MLSLWYSYCIEFFTTRVLKHTSCNYHFIYSLDNTQARECVLENFDGLIFKRRLGLGVKLILQSDANNSIDF